MTTIKYVMGNTMINIDGKNYIARTVEGFEDYRGFSAKIVSNVNTISGEAVAVKVGTKWQFVNPTVK